MEPIIIKEGNWKFQYARWDLRIRCPFCGASEAFFLSIADCDENWIIRDTGRCGGQRKEGYCLAYGAVFQLQGVTDAYIMRKDAYEQAIGGPFNGLRQRSSGPEIPYKNYRCSPSYTPKATLDLIATLPDSDEVVNSGSFFSI